MNNWFIFILLIMISCSSKVKNNTSYNNIGNKYWSDQIEEIDLVISYIISDYDEYKKIKKLSNEDKIIFLDNYFSKLDPDTTTIKNESLEELNKRVLMSKELFSGSDGGLFSDRAKIYIIYGPPKDQYQSYSNNLEVFVWQYEINNKLIEFRFIDDTFGRYKLIIDDFEYINN